MKRSPGYDLTVTEFFLFGNRGKSAELTTKFVNCHKSKVSRSKVDDNVQTFDSKSQRDCRTTCRKCTYHQSYSYNHLSPQALQALDVLNIFDLKKIPVNIIILNIMFTGRVFLKSNNVYYIMSNACVYHLL